MPRASQFLGTGAVVECAVRLVNPVGPWKMAFPNAYETKRERFTVKGVDRTTPDSLTGAKVEMTHTKFPEKTFRAAAGAVKLERRGPPNGLFVNDPVPRQAAGDAAVDADVTDGSSESEDEDLETLHDFGDFVRAPGGVTTDARTAERFPAKLNGSCDSEAAAFELFLPKEYLMGTVLPATSAALVDVGQSPLTYPEFKKWIACWLIISNHPSWQRSDFWADRAKRSFSSMTGEPPKLSSVMSRNRFDGIMQHLRLVDGDGGTDRDRFWQVRPLIAAFNEACVEAYHPSWLLCLDESMVAWGNARAPGWVAIDRKPVPKGNEYHTVADSATGVMTFMEVVEGGSRPKTGPYAVPEFSPEMSKTAALVLRCTKSLFGTGRVIILDSGFGQLPVLTELKKRGLFGTMFIKKRRGWPKGVPGDAIHASLQGADIGKQFAFVANEGSPHNGVWLAAMPDSKHISMMGNTHSTTIQMGEKKKRRVGDLLVEINYAEYQQNYYKARNAVDFNNQLRQGYLSLEAGAATKDWAKRQFFFVLGVIEINAHLCHQHFVLRPKGLEPLSKAQFRVRLAEQLIGEVPAPPAPVTGDGTHRLMALKNNKKKFELGVGFAPAKAKYQKYKCRGCQQQVRTYCACSPEVMRCASCFGNHCRDS